jgi:thioredoxin 1
MQIPWILPVLLTSLLVAVVAASSKSLFNTWLGNGFDSKTDRWQHIRIPRGGNDPIQIDVDGGDTITTVEEENSENIRELTLDEKVQAAMKKLGLSPPSPTSIPNDVDVETTIALEENKESETTFDNSIGGGNSNDNSTNGVCEVPQGGVDCQIDDNKQPDDIPNDPGYLADRISQKLNVDLNMVWAALGATSVGTENNNRIYNETAACEMIQMELDMISQIQEDSDDVKSLVAEGYDSFFVRRALAFAERNINDARAILLADKMDEEEEAASIAKQVENENKVDEKQHLESSFKTLKVDASFDPSKIDNSQTESTLPKAAPRDSVIFDATVDQIQELVLESPVPVLLDIYADWCGPCKALSPILEDIAIKSGGSLRLVKINSDNERALSQALEVTALPTVFGVRDGRILHMFQGMPKSEDTMKDFLMGLLIPGRSFNPNVSEVQLQKYAELSTKLVKVAASASFSFSTKERLRDRIAAQLDNLVQQSANILYAENAVVTMRSLLSNIIRDPYEPKFRTINLSNKVIASNIAKYPACITILKSIGFKKDGFVLTIAKGKAFVNIAPLATTRDAIDKWIDRTRYEVARADRMRRDEEDRKRIQAELAAAKESQIENSESNESATNVVDPDACLVNLRIEGKKKVHKISLRADDPLGSILDRLPVESVAREEGDILITCVAKRLVVKSTDHTAMKKSFRHYGLAPMANIVIKVLSLHGLTPNSEDSVPITKSSKLVDRAASKKKIKKGTHTMQSIGVYSTEDNAKGELIDGGGGTWYEHDVSDDDDKVPLEAPEPFDEVTNISDKRTAKKNESETEAP